MKTSSQMIAVGAFLCAVSASGSQALVFDAQDARAARRLGDWQPNSYKVECGLSQAVIGVSQAPKDGTAHAALCSPDDAAYAGAGDPRNLVFSTKDNRDGKSADWDRGFYKGECGAGEFVVGVSQTPEHKVTSILCSASKANLTHKDCAAQVFAGHEAREAGANKADWDQGFYKGECGAGRYVAGLSQDTKTGRPHAIYCCGR